MHIVADPEASFIPFSIWPTMLAVWRDGSAAPAAGAGDSGVILVTFGSMLNVEPHSILALAKAFATLPQVR